MDDRQSMRKAIFAVLYRVMRVGAIYSPDNEITQGAVDKFMEFFAEAISRTGVDKVSMEIRGDFGIVNAEPLRLGPSSQERLRELRSVFKDAKFRKIEFLSEMTADHLSRFVGHLRRVLDSEHVEDLEAVDVPNIRITHGLPTLSVPDGLASVESATYQARLYVRLLAKVRNLHRTHRKTGEIEVPRIALRRIMRRIAVLFRADERRILGWLPRNVLKPSLATHSVNTALYATFTGDHFGIPPRIGGELGAAVLLQDLDRLEGLSLSRTRSEEEQPSETQRSQNVRDVATHMGEAAAASPAEAFRQILTYERAFPLRGDAPQKMYREPRRLSLASRIVDVARLYDASVQGFAGREKLPPDQAIEMLHDRAGSVIDGAVARLFARSMGTYPVGTRVELSNGEEAIVAEPPGPDSEPDRPVVQLLKDPDRRIDLADERYESSRITGTSHGTGEDPDAQTNTDIFLLT